MRRTKNSVSQSVFFLFSIIIKQFNTKIINIKKIKKRIVLDSKT